MFNFHRSYKKTLLLACGFVMFSIFASAKSLWYVNSTNQSNQDGLSWQNAFNSLQNALSKAQPGDEIWVAKGTYYPDSSDRGKSFELKENLTVYGGFSGDESKLTQRDFNKNLTILSGNIGNGDKTKNSTTVVKGASKAILDGFTISDSYESGSSTMHLLPDDIKRNDMHVGGGMSNFMVCPIVRNCIFKDNSSPKGGGVYNVQDPDKAQAQFINVQFLNNKAEFRGGAVSNDLGAMPLFINCTFIGNTCGDKGGGMYNDFAASPIILNCLFKSNSATIVGAIGNDGGSSPVLVNVTIKDNQVSSGIGSGLYQGTGAQNNPIVINSSIDNVYNWHEDIVVSLNSFIPMFNFISLNNFIPFSNLKDILDENTITELPDTLVGYQSNLDGLTLMENSLIKKLISTYYQNKGAVTYTNTYERPEIKSGEDAIGGIVFVAPESADKFQKDGSSWEKAISNLQQAIDIAAQKKGSVWIKSGTYTPSIASNDKIAAFIMYDDVKLYGGFKGIEKNLSDRNIPQNPTILSAKVKNTNFTYPHVLYGANNTVLDGLTISDGIAYGSTYNGKGGGLLAYHAGKEYIPVDNPGPGVGFKMSIAYCNFVNNQAIEGGAIYIFAKGELTISNTTFINNQAIYGGAVLSREGNVINYNNCFFRLNMAISDGGAMYDDYGAHSNYTNCVFNRNSAGKDGGAIYVISRASQIGATVVNVDSCSFNKNEALKGRDIFNLDDSQVTLKNSKLDSDTLTGNTKFTTLVSIDPMRVQFSIPENHFLGLTRGIPTFDKASKEVIVKLKFDDGIIYNQTGYLSYSDNTVNTSTGSVLTQALFPNKEGSLIPGRQ